MITITLLHPFSAKAIGLQEKDLFYSHSQPHEKALRAINGKEVSVTIDYFTGKLFPYTKNINNFKKCFWPVTKPILKDRHSWRKQHSLIHYIHVKNNTPDLTIINMSGHGSSYSFKLANLLTAKKKAYIAMIGGMHMSTKGNALNYYKNAHHLIVHTNVQKKELLKHKGFENLDIRVVPLGVDTTIFKPLTLEKGKVDKLLYVGRVSRLKQIEIALKTVSFLVWNKKRAVELTIVGPISDVQYYNELLELIEALKITNHVIFKGSVNQLDLIPIYQKSDLLLLPSAHESFGMVMVEAMACGTPVVALEGAGGPDEIVEHGLNGILCTMTNYSDKIYEFLINSKVREKMKSYCVECVEDKWSLNKTISCFDFSIKKALGNI